MFAKIIGHRQTPALTRNGVHLGDRIGSGGYGSVYRCTWRNTHGDEEESAVKIIAAAKDTDQTDLQRELKALRVFDHANLVKLKQVYHLDAHCYIVMEMMGCSLEGHLINTGALPEHRAKFYYKQLLCGLEYMHKRYYGHRDIKCENILLSADEHRSVLKLADFGLTRHCFGGGVRKMSDTICGTEGYMPPEMLDPTVPHYDPLVSDIWSAGCVLYKMLYNHLPYNEPTVFRACRLEEFVTRQRTISVFSSHQNPSDSLRAFIDAHFNANAATRAKVDELLELEWIQ